MSRTARGPWPSVTEQETVGAHRLRLYQLFDDDPTVTDWIDDFAEREWSPLAMQLRRLPEYLPDMGASSIGSAAGVSGDAVAKYLRALRDESDEFGFLWIPRHGPRPERRRVDPHYLRSGRAQVHAYLWMLDKRRLWENRPAAAPSQPEVQRPTFATLASFGTEVPPWDSRIAGTNEQWDPRTETRHDAALRVASATGLSPAAVEATLRQMEAAAGYRTPGTRDEVGGMDLLHRSAIWTYERIRRARTYPDIARWWLGTSPAQVRVSALDATAAEWNASVPERDHDSSPHQLEADVAKLKDQVRKAVEEFGRMADVDVRRARGRRRLRYPTSPPGRP